MAHIYKLFEAGKVLNKTRNGIDITNTTTDANHAHFLSRHKFIPKMIKKILKSIVGIPNIMAGNAMSNAGELPKTKSINPPSPPITSPSNISIIDAIFIYIFFIFK